MDTFKNYYDGMAVFDKPLKINESKDRVYGVLFNREREEEAARSGNHISEYMDYLMGMSQIYRLGILSEDKKKWTFPGFRLTIEDHCDTIGKLVSVLMNGMSKFRLYTFDRPIEWENGEVDTETSGLIINYSLIKRYMTEETSLIQNKLNEE